MTVDNIRNKINEMICEYRISMEQTEVGSIEAHRDLCKILALIELSSWIDKGKSLQEALKNELY